MTWTAPDRAAVDGPVSGPDRPILEAFLAWERATLLSICAGLTPDQLARRPLPSSNLSLLGLVRHAAKVERIWFRQRAGGESIAPLYDLSLGKDFDFGAVDARDAEASFGVLEDEWLLADAAVAGKSFDDTFELDGEAFSVRMTYVHMIGEYARHNGHADLLREALDGVTGR